MTWAIHVYRTACPNTFSDRGLGVLKNVPKEVTSFVNVTFLRGIGKVGLTACIFLYLALTNSIYFHMRPVTIAAVTNREPGKHIDPNPLA